MKKTIMMTVAALMCAAATMAQEVQLSEDGMSATYTKQAEDAGLQPIYRSGNTYILGNQALNKYQYAGYLSQTCPAAYSKFRQGYNMSCAGWGLLAGGLALTTSAAVMGLCHPVKDEVRPYHHVMNTMYWAGNALTTASIPVLIVGYCKMHNSADLYNTNCAKTTPYFTLNAGANGIGLALNY